MRVGHNYRVLQISDICAGASDFNASKWVERIVTSVKSKEGLSEIDYIVVCGNITTSGSEADFRIAKECLVALEKKLLPELPDSERRNRLLVVPGRNDAPITDKQTNEPDFTSFKEFFDEMFVVNSGHFDAWRSDSLQVRHMADLTLIGATYWDESKESKSSLSRLQQFLVAIDQLSRRPEVLHYINSTPTFMVSAETPLYKHALRDAEDTREIFNKLCSKLRNGPLEITMHLVGEGTFRAIPPQPFSFNHATISTGNPTSTERNQPLRFNIMEVAFHPPVNNLKLNSITSHAFLQHHGEPGQWETFTPCNERISSSFEGEMLSEKIVTEIIEAKANGLHGLVVSGFPGSGKDYFCALLKEQATIDGVKVKPIVWQWTTDLKKQDELVEQCEWMGQGYGRYHVLRPLVLVPTVVFDASWRSTLKQLGDLAGRIGGHRGYFIAFASGQPASEVQKCIDSQQPRQLALIQVQPAESKEFKSFAHWRGKRIPLEPEFVNFLTGRYLGCAQSLYDAADHAFESYRGSERIDGNTTLKLMEDVQPSLNSLIRKFFQYLRIQSGSRETLKRIDELIQRKFSFPDWPVSELSWREEDDQDLTSHNNSLVKRMIEDGVIKVSNDTYQLQVPLPFLLSSRRPRYRVFVSRNRLRHKASKILVGHLERLLETEGSWLDCFDYQLPEYSTEPLSQRVENEEDIAQKTVNYRNFIWLHGGEEDVSHRAIALERDTWWAHWRNRSEDQRRMIVVAQRNSHVPVSSEKQRPYPKEFDFGSPEEDHSWESLAREIVRELRPEPSPKRPLR